MKDISISGTSNNETPGESVSIDSPGIYPLLSFSYIKLELLSISILSHMFEVCKKDKEVFGRYVLFIHDSNPAHHNCPISDILIDDYNKYFNVPDNLMENTRMNNWILSWDKDVVDRIFIREEYIIRERLINIINFAIDQVYKTNTIQIEFGRSSYSSIPDIIYSVLLLNYDLIEVCYTKDNSVRCIIKKKEI